MQTETTPRPLARRGADPAHHHPRVQRVRGGWVWSCSCGSRTCRTTAPPSSWRRTLVEALRHSTQLAA